MNSAGILATTGIVLLALMAPVPPAAADNEDSLQAIEQLYREDGPEVALQRICRAC